MSHSSKSKRNRTTNKKEDNADQAFFGKKQDINQGADTPSFFQAKLSVNEPGDSFEQEADSVANSVVNQQGQAPAVQQKKISSIQRLSTSKEDEKPGTNDARMEKDKEIQEKPMAGGDSMEKEEEKGVQKKGKQVEEEDEMNKTGTLQQKSIEGETGTTGNIGSGLDNSSGKGDKLPSSVLHEMNKAFGADFENVRIHKDADAISMNEELKAQAFTHDNDIYFNDGKFNPNSAEGKSLLAHELTHVVQQGAANIETTTSAANKQEPLEKDEDEPVKD